MQIYGKRCMQSSNNFGPDKIFDPTWNPYLSRDCVTRIRTGSIIFKFVYPPNLHNATYIRGPKGTIQPFAGIDELRYMSLLNYLPTSMSMCCLICLYSDEPCQIKNLQSYGLVPKIEIATKNSCSDSTAWYLLINANILCFLNIILCCCGLTGY